jgi:hypothetical protein
MRPANKSAAWPQAVGTRWYRRPKCQGRGQQRPAASTSSGSTTAASSSSSSNRTAGLAAHCTPHAAPAAVMHACTSHQLQRHPSHTFPSAVPSFLPSHTAVLSCVVCTGVPPNELLDANSQWPSSCWESTPYMDRCTATCINGAQGSPSIFCGGAADWDPKTFRGRCIKGPGGCG